MQQAVESLFSDAEVIVVAGKITDHQGELFPEERRLIQNAVPKRVREFTAGRICARRALDQLKQPPPPSPILPDAQRAPIWPVGYTGSITHTDDAVAVVVGSTTRIGAIGLDMESCRRIEKSLWPQLFTDRETDWLESLSGAQQARTAALFFSAKESFFKFQFPRHRQWIEFKEASVRIVDHRTFSLRLSKATADRLGPPRDHTGRYRFHNGSVITGMWAGIEPGQSVASGHRNQNTSFAAERASPMEG